jgi:hypothetical protein
MLFEIEGAGSAYIANLRAPLVAAVPALARPFDELEFVVATLEAVGLAPVVQAALARNFEYYSGIVFRFESAGRRLIAGGRYDELVTLIGGRAVPASGFALYVTPVVHSLAPAPSVGGPGVVLLVPESQTPGDVGATHIAGAALRGRGMTVETVSSSAAGAVITCRENSPRYSVVRDGETTVFKDVDDLVRATELLR